MKLVKNANIDKKCAEYGFEICDHVKEIYDLLNNELKTLQKKTSVDLLECARNIYKSVTESLSQNVKEFEKYVRIKVLEELTKQAESIQKSKISDEEKIEKFSRERKFSDFADDCENALRKVLGILSSDGVFASVIWIESNEEKEEYRAIKYQISKFLNEIFKSDGKFSGDPGNLRSEVLKACDSTPQIFFIKQILEQMLTYALYRARSLR